jgi:myo-inositol-1(or 4)-monophosphatase
VAARSRLEDCVIATGSPHLGRPGHEDYQRQLAAVMPAVAGVRRFGAASLDLAWVAAGRYDGYWESGLSAWDIAAGLVILREAGGFATDLSGGKTMLESGGILAGNERVHRALLKLL